VASGCATVHHQLRPPPLADHLQNLTTILGQGVITLCLPQKFINNRQRFYYQNDLQRHLLMPIHLYFYLILLSVVMHVQI